jgi:16S rRNA (cytosine1402-N4)-methyltransferase
VLDCTLGLGGHAQALCEAIGKKGSLTAFDADAVNFSTAEIRLRKTATCALDLRQQNFSHVSEIADASFDVILADIGLSSPHLDDPSRGFSFRGKGILDMRFDQKLGVPAWQMLCDSDASRVTEVLRNFGELHRGARAVASGLIAQAKMKQHEMTTEDAKNVVEHVYGFRAKNFMAQVFQALRMHVNNELSVLDTLLVHIPRLLRSGGRAGVISFHSLEDRAVKHSFRTLCLHRIDDRTGQILQSSSFSLLTKRGVQPSDEEILLNPRSRSARLRAIQRLH